MVGVQRTIWVVTVVQLVWHIAAPQVTFVWENWSISIVTCWPMITFYSIWAFWAWSCSLFLLNFAGSSLCWCTSRSFLFLCLALWFSFIFAFLVFVPFLFRLIFARTLSILILLFVFIFLLFWFFFAFWIPSLRWCHFCIFCVFFISGDSTFWLLRRRLLNFNWLVLLTDFMARSTAVCLTCLNFCILTCSCIPIRIFWIFHKSIILCNKFSVFFFGTVIWHN